MVGPARIEGYAIVSRDGMLADASGTMPASLMSKPDQAFFAHGLDGVDVVVHGRHSHEQQPHSPARRRLILTHRVAGVAPHPSNGNARFWNPAGAALEQAMEELGTPGGSVGVIGGTNVFNLFLDRYDIFYLSRLPHVKLPGGRPVFPEVPSHAPEDVLARHGLDLGYQELFDRPTGLVIVGWRRAPDPDR